MGRITAWMTASQTVFNDTEEGYTEEHGWIDPPWSRTQLHDSRNDVRPLLDLWIEDDDLTEELRDILIGFNDNGDGSYYGNETESFRPNESWHYAIHLKHKFFGPDGWVEAPYHPSL